jgi:hypothetical protein
MLNIPANIDTPSILCDSEKGSMHIKGISIPENSMEFYDVIIKWLSYKIDVSKTHFDIHIGLEYFNTSSLKSLLNLIKIAVQKNTADFKVSVKWYFDADDEDMKYRGEELSMILKYPFEYILNS